MKYIYLTIASLFCFALTCSAQQDYPKGVYMSLGEIIEKQPSVQRKMVTGGKGFRNVLVSVDSLDRDVVRDEIYGYSNGDTLYINCKPILGKSYYSKVESDGKFLVFMVYNEDFPLAIGLSFITLGLTGAGIAAGLTSETVYYLLDKETGETRQVGWKYLRKLLRKHSDVLWYQFMQEKDPRDKEAQIYYLDVLNREWASGGLPFKGLY